MRWKNKISVARNLYSILIVFLIFSTNFLPLLNLHPSSSFAQDEPISEAILEEQFQNIIQNDKTSADEKPVIIDDQTTKLKEESVDLNQQPKKEEPAQKSVIQPETQPTEKIEVLVVDSGVGALNTIAENVIYDCNPASILSCITTDKEDYAPTVIVKILGYAYEPKELYELLIYSNDDPAVRFVTDIVASENGTLEYSYQLDGNYRPQYYIEVHKVSTNSSNEVVKIPIAKKKFYRFSNLSL